MSDVPSASKAAYKFIRDAILMGTYQPGTMLGEIPLSREIGVSRTPVRTALALLQDEGWVTLYPKRGALVQGVSEQEASDFMEARFILESTGVQRSTPQSRSQMREHLEELVRDQRHALQNNDVQAFIESTIAFHRSFVEVSDNRVLLELYDRLADRQRYLLFKIGAKLLDRSDEIIAEHTELIDCLCLQNDPEEFSELLRKHMVGTSGRSVSPLYTPVP